MAPTVACWRSLRASRARPARPLFVCSSPALGCCPRMLLGRLAICARQCLGIAERPSYSVGIRARMKRFPRIAPLPPPSPKRASRSLEQQSRPEKVEIVSRAVLDTVWNNSGPRRANFNIFPFGSTSFYTCHYITVSQILPFGPESAITDLLPGKNLVSFIYFAVQ